MSKWTNPYSQYHKLDVGGVTLYVYGPVDRGVFRWRVDIPDSINLNHDTATVAEGTEDALDEAKSAAVSALKTWLDDVRESLDVVVGRKS